jgi:pimeloyl-ACP methyl ester carboxylesterase
VAEKPVNPPWPISGTNKLLDYRVDAWQRSILLLDVLRQRGNNSIEHNARKAPNVLSFEAELVLDGRSLPRPVNYGLVRILPPEGISTDRSKRPFIVFDSRAGHGLRDRRHIARHQDRRRARRRRSLLFRRLSAGPWSCQTIEDVCEAEARFVEEVVKLHPNAEGKPFLIGNCQAGWRIMMMAAIHPERVGPLMLAEPPLSYWAGVHDKNPMRYSAACCSNKMTETTSVPPELTRYIDGGYPYPRLRDSPPYERSICRAARRRDQRRFVVPQIQLLRG